MGKSIRIQRVREKYFYKVGKCGCSKAWKQVNIGGYCNTSKCFLQQRIIYDHEFSCIIEFIKPVEEKRSDARLAEHFITFAKSLINSIAQHEHEC